MRLMIVAASVAVLGLAACNQEEDAPTMDETVAAEDTGATDPAPDGAPVAESAMQESAVPPTDMNNGAGPGPVTDDVRADAQTEAESTNLRPRTE